MFAIIVVGHGEFSTGLVNATEMILGEQENLIPVPLLPNSRPENYLTKLNNIVKDYEEFVILADLKGGTPANTASFIVKEYDCKCITGANLPIILEIVSGRMGGMTMEESILKALNVENAGVCEINKNNIYD